jgi:hypothetical protein
MRKLCNLQEAKIAKARDILRKALKIVGGNISAWGIRKISAHNLDIQSNFLPPNALFPPRTYRGFSSTMQRNVYRSVGNVTLMHALLSLTGLAVRPT